MVSNNEPLNFVRMSSYLLAAIALIVVMHYGLLVALLSGLLVYSLVHQLAPCLSRRLGNRLNSRRARIVIITALGMMVVAALSAATWAVITFFQSQAGSIPTLMHHMADILENSRNQLPDWIRTHLPENIDQIRIASTEWLRTHAIEAKLVSERVGKVVVHLLLGMIIGAMVALHDVTHDVQAERPLSVALHKRLLCLQNAFQQIVFAQVQIAFINAALIACYLLIILPMVGITLPLTKSLITITFLVGLIPVAGNLISNTVLVIVGLSHSPQIAVLSLLFMVIVHKLEYFLNARIIGAQIQARPWELLVAIVVMEAIFGLPGVVAAPVLYAYIKHELIAVELV